jgi:hypothetical protein
VLTGLKRQTVCKPGSVRAACAALDGHSSGTRVAARLTRPTRVTGRERPRVTRHSFVCRAAGHPYSVLLPVGFTLPAPLPERRCALTAPFHPCLRAPICTGRAQAVCFLWHCPWGRPRRPLAGTVFPWSPDFPPPCPHGHGSGRPTVWRALIASAAASGQAMPRTVLASTAARSAVSASARPVTAAGRHRRWKARSSVAKASSPSPTG